MGRRELHRVCNEPGSDVLYTHIDLVVDGRLQALDPFCVRHVESLPRGAPLRAQLL